MLAMADSNGLVEATAPGIARKACIPIESCRQALNTFESPDEDSRTKSEEGRRIQRVDGGYQILNYSKYREKDYTNAVRQARHRNKSRNAVTSVTDSVHSNAGNTVTSLPVTQAEAEADTKSTKPNTPTSKFIKPTLAEVSTYCSQRRNGIDPEQFIAHYESNGWRVGKTPMKNWHFAVITWEKSRSKEKNNGKSKLQNDLDRIVEGLDEAPTGTSESRPPKV